MHKMKDKSRCGGNRGRYMKTNLRHKTIKGTALLPACVFHISGQYSWPTPPVMWISPARVGWSPGWHLQHLRGDIFPPMNLKSWCWFGASADEKLSLFLLGGCLVVCIVNVDSWMIRSSRGDGTTFTPLQSSNSASLSHPKSASFLWSLPSPQSSPLSCTEVESMARNIRQGAHQDAFY